MTLAWNISSVTLAWSEGGWSFVSITVGLSWLDHKIEYIDDIEAFTDKWQTFAFADPTTFRGKK